MQFLKVILQFSKMKVEMRAIGGISMCGRFYLDADAEFLLNYFKIQYEPKVLIEQPLIFPTQYSPVVIESKGDRRIGLMKWGFKLPNSSRPIINSRSETIQEKKMFKEAFEKRRCIVPASGFFEWSDYTDQKPKPQYKISIPDQPIMCMAGIYTKVMDESGQIGWVFSIVTRDANEDMRAIHPRMPLMLRDAHLSSWMSQETSLEQLNGLLRTDIGRLDIVQIG